MVNVALPSMRPGYAGSGAIEWVVAGYGLTTAVFLITGARLGDRWGRRRVFTLGLGPVHHQLGCLRPDWKRRGRWSSPGWPRALLAARRDPTCCR